MNIIRAYLLILLSICFFSCGKNSDQQFFNQSESSSIPRSDSVQSSQGSTEELNDEQNTDNREEYGPIETSSNEIEEESLQNETVVAANMIVEQEDQSTEIVVSNDAEKEELKEIKASYREMFNNLFEKGLENKKHKINENENAEIALLLKKIRKEEVNVHRILAKSEKEGEIVDSDDHREIVEKHAILFATTQAHHQK